MNENWLSDPYVQKWLSKLTDRTKENCVREFPKFLEWSQKTPAELIKMKVENLQSRDSS